ncbi:MAG: glycosyltransferase family A protein [Gemmatimonadaceae bacterium]
MVNNNAMILPSGLDFRPLNIDDISITTVIPVYNGEKFVERAVRSVQMQACSATEIFVVDDCSTDATASIVTAMAESDPRVRLLRNATNQGPSYCRNRGMMLAESSIVAFLDADDWWLHDHLNHIRDAYVTFPNASVAYSRTVDSELESEFMHKPTITELPDAFLRLLKENPIPQSMASVRTAHARLLGGYRDDARFAEDYAFWLRFALAGCQFVTVSAKTGLRTLHGKQVSYRNAVDMYRAAWRYRREAVGERCDDINSLQSSVVEALVQAQRNDMLAALGERRRDLLQEVIASSSWIPGSDVQLERARHLSGWAWPFWRLVARVYDGLPSQVQNWWRKRRTLPA